MSKRKLFPQLALALLFAVAASATAKAQATLPELIRRVKPSVVSVITYNDKGEVKMTGSGFFVGPGQVVTNLHVIEGAARAEVRTFEGKGKTYAVNGVVALDAEGDLAVLGAGAPSERTRPLELAPEAPEEGEQIFVIGNPLRLEGSVSDGIVSAVREIPGLDRIIQITAPVSHGNSGSPVFNMRGQVVGVVTIKVTNGQNINLAMGASRVAALTPRERMLSFGEVRARVREGQRPEEWFYRNGLNSLWLGNYDSALDYFENAVDKDPNRVEAWIQVGFCRVKQGKNSEAVRAYKEAIRLRPDSAEAYNKLGDAYYYAGNFYKAAEAYKEAIRLQPRMAEAYYNLGMTYLELGDRNAALTQSAILKPLDRELYKKLSGELER